MHPHATSHSNKIDFPLTFNEFILFYTSEIAVAHENITFKQERWVGCMWYMENKV